MITNHYYRFLCNEVGIYAAVDRDCPRDDIRRKTKPDGSWLPKVGPDFPGAISFWTQVGLRQYHTSGLLQWHCSVVKEPVQVMICTEVDTVLYTDDYQIICKPQSVLQQSLYTLDIFLQLHQSILD
ncbi:MAG: hypothetical protein AAF629_08810 [Chloroflexota bacterium]